MRYVIHIISGLKVGGAESMLLRLLKSNPSDVKTSIIALDPHGGMQERFNEIGVELIILNLKKNFFSDFIKLIKILKQRKPNVVQTWLYHADLFGGIAARLAGIEKIYWGIRNTKIPQSFISSTGIVVLINAALSYVVPNKIVCCALSAKKYHQKLLYSKNKMMVIFNGYDVKENSFNEEGRIRLRKCYDIKDDEFVIGIAGRFDILKGFGTFIQAIEKISKKNHNLKIMMMGSGIVSTNPMLINAINKAGLSDKFILLGERADVNLVMSAIDIYCLSSIAEGFPNVVAEAMLCGKPCVVTNVGDASYIVGETGYSVTPSNSTALANAIQKMILLPLSVRMNRGALARERICKLFDIQHISIQFEKLYG